MSVLCSGCRVLNVGDSLINKCISREEGKLSSSSPNIYSHVKDQGKLSELQSSLSDNMAELSSTDDKILSITPSSKIWPSSHEKAVPFICALSKAYSLALPDKNDSSPKKTFKAGFVYYTWSYSSLHKFFNILNI